MKEDLENVKDLGQDLFAELNKITAHAQIGNEITNDLCGEVNEFRDQHGVWPLIPTVRGSFYLLSLQWPLNLHCL